MAFSSGICVRSLNARSIHACAWYSAGCSLVYESRMGAAWFAGRGQGNIIARILPTQHPGDDAIFAFIDPATGFFPAHGTVNGLDRELPGMRGCA